MTLTHAEATAAPFAMHGDRIFSAMYLNELVMRLCARGDPHSDLFDHYVECLTRLSSAEPQAWTLRRFERDLMIDLGYGLVLDRDIDSGLALEAGSDYAYIIDSGPRRWLGNRHDLKISGDALLALASDEMPSTQQCVELRQLLRVLLQHQLGGGSLNAWSMRIQSR